MNDERDESLRGRTYDASAAAFAEIRCNVSCFMSLFQFRPKAEYWLRITLSAYPHAFDAPVTEVPITILP